MSENIIIDHGLIIKDERTVSPDELHGSVHANILRLEDVLSLLASPDSGKTLKALNNGIDLTDGDNIYQIINGLPVLYPFYLSKHIEGGGMPLQYYEDSRLQYFLLSQIKQYGEINAPSTNVHYQRHLFRMKDFVRECSGTVLDVGCDNVEISSAIFGSGCHYIGLDPFSNFTKHFRIIGVGEHLPVRNDAIDNIVFNTSLDHMIDYHRAIHEARRVLRPGGTLWISTLIWTELADLQDDAIHFHHFRKYEIDGVLDEYQFRVLNQKAYDYKGDSHRYGLYVSAKKSGI